MPIITELEIAECEELDMVVLGYPEMWGVDKISKCQFLYHRYIFVTLMTSQGSDTVTSILNVIVPIQPQIYAC